MIGSYSTVWEIAFEHKLAEEEGVLWVSTKVYSYYECDTTAVLQL